MILHADPPRPEDVLVGEGTQGLGIQAWDDIYGEQEIPVRVGAPLHVKTIEWGKGGPRPMLRSDDGGGWDNGCSVDATKTAGKTATRPPLPVVNWKPGSDGHGGSGVVSAERGPVVAYRGFGSWGEPKDSLQRGEWISSGMFTTRGEGDTQMALDLNDVLQQSGKHRLRGTGFLGFIEADISGLPFETHRTIEVNPIDETRGSFEPDTGLGIGIVGGIPLDRIRRVVAINEDGTWNEMTVQGLRNSIDQLKEREGWEAEVKYLPETHRIVIIWKKGDDRYHHATDNQNGARCGWQLGYSTETAYVRQGDLMNRPPRGRIKNLWFGEMIKALPSKPCDQCFVWARTQMVAALHEQWIPGEQAWFEYHCFESDASCDAELWHHSHQQVTVVRQLGPDEVDEGEGTIDERLELGMPRMYEIRFEDGFSGHVTEDELSDSKADWERPDPPAKTAAKTANWVLQQRAVTVPGVWHDPNRVGEGPPRPLTESGSRWGHGGFYGTRNQDASMFPNAKWIPGPFRIFSVDDETNGSARIWYGVSDDPVWNNFLMDLVGGPDDVEPPEMAIYAKVFSGSWDSRQPFYKAIADKLKAENFDGVEVGGEIVIWKYPAGGYKLAKLAALESKMYHLTAKVDFRLDPNKHPQNNTTWGGDWPDPGIFVTTGWGVEHWCNGYGYWQPWVVEFDMGSVMSDERVRAYEGDEVFVPATVFDKIRITRVIPLDAHCREVYGALGWTESDTGTYFDTFEPIPEEIQAKDWYAMKGYRYPGDARQTDSTWQSAYAKRVRKYRSGRTNAIASLGKVRGPSIADIFASVKPSLQINVVTKNKSTFGGIGNYMAGGSDRRFDKMPGNLRNELKAMEREAHDKAASPDTARVVENMGGMERIVLIGSGDGSTVGKTLLAEKTSWDEPWRAPGKPVAGDYNNWVEADSHFYNVWQYGTDDELMKTFVEYVAGGVYDDSQFAGLDPGVTLTIYRGISMKPGADVSTSVDSRGGVGRSWTLREETAMAIAERGQAGFSNANTLTNDVYLVQMRELTRSDTATIPTVVRAEVTLSEEGAAPYRPWSGKYLSEAEIDMPHGTEVVINGWRQAELVPVNPAEKRKAEDAWTLAEQLEGDEKYDDPRWMEGRQAGYYVHYVWGSWHNVKIQRTAAGEVSSVDHAMHLWRDSFGGSNMIAQAAAGQVTEEPYLSAAKVLLDGIAAAPVQRWVMRVDHRLPAEGDVVDFPLFSAAASSADAAGYETFSNSFGLGEARGIWYEMLNLPALAFPDGREYICSGQFRVKRVSDYKPSWEGRPGSYVPLEGKRKLVSMEYVGPSRQVTLTRAAMAVPLFKGTERNMSERNVIAAANRLLADIAREYGYKGELPAVEITDNAYDLGSAAARSVDITDRNRDLWPHGCILLDRSLVERAQDKELGYTEFRIVAHEAIHALIQRDEPSYPGYSQMITEGGAEVLSVAYWAKNAPGFDDRDAVRINGKWVPGDIALVHGMNYKEWVAELMLRTASKVGWNLESILREVQRIVSGNTNVKLDFRDTSNPTSPRRPVSRTRPRV